MSLDITVNFPNEYPLRSGEQSDGVQMSPLALLWIREHIKWLIYRAQDGSQTDDLYSRELAFPSSRKIKILEYGSGESTICLATMFPEAAIYSVEGEQKWYDWVNKTMKEKNLLNIQQFFVEQDSNYRPGSTEGTNSWGNKYNLEYATIIDRMAPPFDLIINDGGIREIVGDTILNKADQYIAYDGMYLRHDYDMAIQRSWLGSHLNPLPDWVNDKERPCYDNFCATHPKYEMITVSGNGKWGWRCELGGVWRRTS